MHNSTRGAPIIGR